MWLSHLTLNERDRDAIRDLSDCHELHRTIMRAFPDSDDGAARQQHGVLFRVDGDPPQVLVQSTARPNWGWHERGYATVRGPKRMPLDTSTVTSGTSFRFRLVANPVTRHDGKRTPIVGEDAQLAWLERQGDRHGFRVRTATVARHSDVVGGGRRDNRIVHRCARFDGRLDVTDADTFVAAVKAGIGPGKAHGLGLLTLAR